MDRHGNWRYYVRLRGKLKIRIREKYDTPEFWAAYRDALAGKIKPRISTAGPVAGSFRALCVKYFKAPEFKALDVSTRTWRRRALEDVCAAKGNNPVAMMESRHVRRLRDELAEKPGAANQRLKALKALFSWAMEAEEIKHNPARDVRLIKYKTKEHHTWTLAEVETFEKRWPLGTKPRLAMALMLYTAGRREDATRLGPKHIVEGRVVFTQAKNEDRKPIDV
jgi:hypothetical protein